MKPSLLKSRKIVDAKAGMQPDLVGGSQIAFKAGLDQSIQQGSRRSFQWIGLKEQAGFSIGPQADIQRRFFSVFMDPFLDHPQW